MSKSGDISFEDWVTWMFDRAVGDWEWDIDTCDCPWLDNTNLLTAHFVRLHDAPRLVLNPYSNDQIGWGLKALYSGASDVGSPYTNPDVPDELRFRAIRSIATLIREIAPRRLPRDESLNGDALYLALYMYWDIAPIWPFGPNAADHSKLEVCLSEMKAALSVDHPVAAYHALHGLGHFALQVRDRTTPIIDSWLATRPNIGPALRDYAAAARTGCVQ
jgi:hypothetical protein